MPRAINTFVFKTAFLAGQVFCCLYPQVCFHAVCFPAAHTVSIYLSIYLSIYRSEVYDWRSRMVFMLSVLALLTVSSVSKGSSSSTSAFTALSEAQIHGSPPPLPLFFFYLHCISSARAHILYAYYFVFLYTGASCMRCFPLQSVQQPYLQHTRVKA